MRRFWPLLLFVIIFAVVLLRPDQQSTPITTTTDNYQRIISLSPSITETAFALGLGDKVVAVTDYCEYPPEVQSLPKVGGYIDTSIEAVINLQPDLVLMLDNQQKLQQQLKQLGIDTLTVDNTRIDSILAGIQTIGDKTGHQQQAQQLLQHIQQQMDTVARKVKNAPRPRVMISIAHYTKSADIDMVYIAGQHDFYNDLLQRAGGENVYQDTLLKVPSLSAEGVIQLNPDIIIDVFPEADDHNTDLALVRQQWQQLDKVKAVQHQRVYIIEADYASVPGPRVFNLLEQFARILHPELDWDKP